MEEEAVEVVSLGVETVERAIQHVGEPRQGVPVGGITGSEGPGNPLQRETVTHVRVFDDVLVVVEGDKCMSLYLPVHRQRRQRQPKSEKEGGMRAFAI
jgi:hypothetical protein